MLIGSKRFATTMFFAVGVYGFASTLTGQAKPGAKVDFVHDVQPILSAHCVRCHAHDQKGGGLALDSNAGMMAGGDTGRIVTPGKSAQSTLMVRLLGQHGLPRMPLNFGSLNDHDISLIRAWIDQGCVVSTGKRVHWAYVAPIRPLVPHLANAQWVRNPIDAFVLKRLRQEGLSPSPVADKTTLIRRVTLDLTGLPPSPGEVDAFIADKSPDAYEKVVDRLFASPHYGERMALPWLDAARYADSNGFQQDGDTFQYMWRDWVIRAMNANMPFDKFTEEQLAGDLMPGASPDTPEGRDLLVATAFNRNNMLNGEGGAIPEEQRNVALFDRVDTTSTTWLGLTMTCARCHDHKYDPLSQRDYYSLMAFFNNVPETGIPSENDGKHFIAAPYVYDAPQDQLDKLKSLTAEVEKAKADKVPADKLKATQKSLDDLKNSIPKVMIMSDKEPRKTHIYSRGNYTTPLTEVSCSTPLSLAPMASPMPKNRLGLAEWMVSPTNPLTARVQVNRYWQTFFGKGLVKTPENFGVQSEPPSNPELLDWLAVEFRESGWNVKHIQRLIITSSTYRQSSKVSQALLAKDPENRLLARGGRFRMPSMVIRDEALAASGLLNPAMFGTPVYPYQPKGIWDGLNITDERDFSYPQSKGADLYRRSIYTFWRRTVAPGDMFDASSRQVCTVRMGQTSTPLHALTTMNDVTWVEAGRALAQNVIEQVHGGPDARINEAFRRVCARRPSAPELAVLHRTLQRALVAFKADPKAADEYLKQGDSPRDTKIDPIEHAAYATLCLAILNLDEALTRE